MSVIRYPHYRDYSAQRIEANKAVMAFLAGSQLARHALTLTQGSQRLLPEVFPNIPHISRFNLRSDLAMEVLTDAEAHLGAMAIPYLLAIHEDYITSGVLDLLTQESRITRKAVKDARLADMHELVDEATGDTGSTFAPEFLSIFHLLHVTRVFIAGLALDFCVRYSAEDAVHEGFEVVVIDDACRAIDTDGSRADTLKSFEALGVKMIRTEDLR